MIKRNLIFLFFYFLLSQLSAQEFQSRVTVLAQQIGTSVDRKIFTTLQDQLTNFINTRKWTDDAYRTEEKIQCNFLLNIESVTDGNVFKASLTVQASRPVYNASYQAVLLNFKDADVIFKYVQFQPIEFDENRIQGSDALAANLTATFAYYIYFILGLNGDSFSPKGGSEYFTSAENIVTNAPESKDIVGWKPFDGVRNRYWLAENITNNKYNIIHDIIYSYYRTGFDKMYEDANTGRQNIINALAKLSDFNTENANTMILQVLMQSKYDEYVGIFQKASPPIKSKAVDLLSRLDVANSSKYKDALK